MLPKVLKTTPPPPPTKLSYSFGFKMNKRQARKLGVFYNTLSRPAQVPPRKKVAWRLVRKWFNRYEKERLIGNVVRAVSKDGKTHLNVTVTSVSISKAGGSKKTYVVNAKPTEQWLSQQL